MIFLLGDGMGDSEITIARNYQYGAAGRLPGIDTLPLTGDFTTYALQEADPSKPDYVTDSAASGTGWATGHKTSNGRISTTAKTDLTLPTILEQVAKKGWATGNVSTAEITDATPAVLASHINARGCQGPADMAACPKDKKAAGGLGSIAEQTVDHSVDVLLGGGKRPLRPDDRPAARTPARRSSSRPRRSATPSSTDAAGLDAVNDRAPVLGLFNAGNMTSSGTARWPRRTPGTGPQRLHRDEPARPANEPSLAAMTQKAIDLLLEPKTTAQAASSCRSRAPRSTSRTTPPTPCGQIGETIAFDQAIQVALDYAKTHPDTLIVVTADHAHTSQIVDPASARSQRRGDRHPHHQRGRADGRSTTRTNPEGRLAEPHRHRRCGSPPRARRRPTSSACTTRPTCTTCSRARPASSSDHANTERTDALESPGERREPLPGRFSEREHGGDAAPLEPARDDQALDLGRAFPDAVDAQLAPQPLGRVRAHVAAAAQHLHDGVGDAAGGLRGGELGHRGLAVHELGIGAGVGELATWRVSSFIERHEQAASASGNETPWKSMMRCPNCSRSSAHAVPISSSRSIAPTQRAAMCTRSSMNHSFVSASPAPTAPRRWPSASSTP